MRTRTIIASAAVAALGIATVVYIGSTSGNEAPPPAQAAPQVTVIEAQFRSIRQWDDLTGRLEAIDSVSVHPRVSGQIVMTGFADGEKVRKGQLLFQIDPRPYQAEVDRYRADTQRARAKLDFAASENRRGERMAAQNALAPSDLDRLKADERDARAGLASASAALRAALLNLEFTRVTSPIDGTASKILITRGNLVSPADLLTTVVSAGPIYASFNTDEQTFLRYSQNPRGQGGSVYIGLMDESGYPHQGRLSFLDNAMDAGSGTINARAVFDNRDGRLTPGLFARVRLIGGTPHAAAFVPDRAIGTDLGKRYVLVLGAGNKVQYRTVELGQMIDGVRVVSKGLRQGERIVVDGLQKVKAGDVVMPRRIAPPAISASVDALHGTASEGVMPHDASI
jgi:RND family efflux transporter MFP subunit